MIVQFLNETKSKIIETKDKIKDKIKKHKKLFIFLNIVAILIIFINFPYDSLTLKQTAGNPKAQMAKMAMSGKMPTSIPKGFMTGTSSGTSSGSGKTTKLFKGLANPLDTGTNMMWWITRNILLFYAFLIIIVLLPGVPIVGYVVLFYFIMSGLVGKIGTV